MNPERPVVLLHGYGPERHRPDKQGRDKRNKPDRIGRLQALAACELYRRGEVSKIVITACKDSGDLIADQIHRNIPHIPETDIVASHKAPTTWDEIREFQKIVRHQGWDNLMSIGDAVHLHRIKTLFHRFFASKSDEIQILSSQEILNRYPRYQRIIENLGEWEEEKEYRMQEHRLNTILDKIKRNRFFLDFFFGFLPRIIPKKVVIQIWALRQLRKRSEDK